MISANINIDLTGDFRPQTMCCGVSKNL